MREGRSNEDMFGVIDERGGGARPHVVLGKKRSIRTFKIELRNKPSRELMLVAVLLPAV